MPDNKKTFTDAEALDFHKHPTPGKISILPTKPMATQRDLSLAYSPGVAVPVKAISSSAEGRTSPRGVASRISGARLRVTSTVNSAGTLFVRPSASVRRSS